MEFNLLSFNIRLDVSSDHENRFIKRKEHIKVFLEKNKFDLIGFQEVTPDIYSFLKHTLSEFDSFIEYRGDNLEAVPIFYRKNLLKLLEQDTFWLSDTPHIPSKFERSAHHRICTYGVFEHMGKLLIYLNIHLDYKYDDICLKQAKIALQKITILRKKYPQSSIILGGDFNQKLNSKTILYIRKHLKSLTKPGYLTFHGYQHIKFGEPIDYFFYDNVTKASFDILLDQPKEGFLSDHYPIKLTITI